MRLHRHGSQVFGQGLVFGQAVNARSVVLLFSVNSQQISCQERPCERSGAILAGSAATMGSPETLALSSNVA